MDSNFDDAIWQEFDNTVTNIDSNISTHNVINQNFCEDCKSSNVIVDLKGATVCQDCGIVQGFTLDKNPEWINGDEGGGAENDRCGNAGLG
jgi:hypothetical protein